MSEWDRRSVGYVRVRILSGRPAGVRRLRLEALETRLALATYEVNALGDIDDGDPNNGATTLREAINLANAAAGTDDITFNLPAGSTITLGGTELLLNSDMRIRGASAAGLAISGNYQSRVLNVNTGVTAEISDLTITRALAMGVGGNVYNRGTLTIRQCTISESLYPPLDPIEIGSNKGGGVYNLGTLTIHQCMIGNNRSNDGGGVYNLGMMTIAESTIRGNTALKNTRSAEGGGVHNSGTMTILGSTIDGNRAYYGGGIHNRGTLTVSHSTIRNNTAEYGGGAYNLGTMTIVQSTISDHHTLEGGGISNRETMSILQSTIRNNRGSLSGGGISNIGELTVSQSTISNNTTDFVGGGIAARGQVTISQSAITGNVADKYGGGAYSSGMMTITQSTISANAAGNRGGGVYNYNSGTLRVSQSTISENTVRYSSTVDGGGIASFGNNTTHTEIVGSIVAGNFGPENRAGGDLGLVNGSINSFISLGNNLFGSFTRAVGAAWTSGPGANGHNYEVVRVPGGVDWEVASAAARDAGGHLAAITSDEENSFVFGQVNHPQYWSGGLGPWLGSFQGQHFNEPDGGWQWITGEAFNAFTNWGPSQPDNAGAGEDRLHFFNGAGTTPAPTWNDLASTSTLPIAYVIEYDALPYHPSDLVGVNPLLGPLANNGGPTQTHALLPGSPAIDAIAASTPGVPATDQRGFGRPFGGGFDIGSYESGRPTCSDGDANGDGRIDRADLAILATNFGLSPATCPQGDFDNNGRVNLHDLVRLQANFLVLPSPPASSPAAPEATAAVANASGESHEIGASRNRIERRAAPTTTPSPRLTATRTTSPRTRRELTTAIDAAHTSLAATLASRARR